MQQKKPVKFCWSQSRPRRDFHFGSKSSEVEAMKCTICTISMSDRSEINEKLNKVILEKVNQVKDWLFQKPNKKQISDENFLGKKGGHK